MNRIAVLIVAGGSGTRMGSEIPKQFLPLNGTPILMHTIRRFAETLTTCRLIVVLPQAHLAYWQELCQIHEFTLPHTLCAGGATRFDSVRQGLSLIGEADLVAIHDGVRPLVTRTVILRTLHAAATYGAVIPVITPVDSLRYVDSMGNSQRVDRAQYRCVQTPQVFQASLLIDAYKQPYLPHFTDDASVVEAAGGRIHLCEGDDTNIKITSPTDIIRAETLLLKSL